MNTPLKVETAPQAIPTSMRRARLCLVLGAALSVQLVAGCASSPTYHRYFMQGQVLSVDGNSLVVCVGSRDGAQVGQELAVIRNVALPPQPKSGAINFRRESVGKVRVTTVLDEHYASAEVLTGSPRTNDVVELERK